GRTAVFTCEFAGRVAVVDVATQVIGQIPLGAGTHGIYPSRDGSVLYVTSRIAGTVTVLDPVTGAVKATWPVPGGSPDMGGVTADGTQVWLSGRYNREVYVISTADGSLLARIPVGDGPHGLCVWPQPGRYSLGHTGVTRQRSLGVPVPVSSDAKVIDQRKPGRPRA